MQLYNNNQWHQIVSDFLTLTICDYLYTQGIIIYGQGVWSIMYKNIYI
jgi:hypothetical protein